MRKGVMSTSHRGAWGAVALACSAVIPLGSGTAFSQGFVIPGGATAGQQSMTGAGDTGVVYPSGTIVTFGAGEDAVLMLNSNQHLTNSGRIGTFGGGASNVDSQGDDAIVVNTGLMFSQGNGSVGVESAGQNATILNAGSFLGLGDGSIGIVIAGDDARIVNDGSIQLVGDGALAITSDGANAHVDNRGLIAVSAVSAGGVGGILGDKPDFNVVNSGSIEVYGAGGLGIGWQGSSGFHLVNSGSITVAGAAAIGIGAQGDGISIVNSGTVDVSGATAIGTLGNATITNSGSVIADGANTVGITALGGSATITNSGRIFSEQSAAIFFGSSGGTLNLLGGTAIQGPIVFSGAGNTISFGPGLSAAMTFLGSGVPQTILTGGRPFVVNGDTVDVVDVTGFAGSAPLVEDIADDIASVAEARMAGRDGDAVTRRGGPDAWLAAFGSIRSQGASGVSAGFSLALGGVAAGVEKSSGDGFLGGVLLGGLAGSTEVDDGAQEIAHHGVFAGAYLDYDEGVGFVRGNLIAGVLQERSRRRVANNTVLDGVETARADFNSVFVSPSVTIGTRLPVSAGTLMPSIRFRYAGLFADGYAESGSASDLAVSRRGVNVFDARAQLALALAPVSGGGHIWQTTFRVGVDALAQDSEDVSATLLGQDMSFAAGDGKAALRGFAGLDLVAETGAGMMLNAGFEAGYGSDKAFTVRGEARLSKAF